MQRTTVPASDEPDVASLWDPATGAFDGLRLRRAMVLRGWTVGEFARVARVSRASMYNAVAGKSVSDHAAIRVFQTLAAREPVRAA